MFFLVAAVILLAVGAATTPTKEPAKENSIDQNLADVQGQLRDVLDLFEE